MKLKGINLGGWLLMEGYLLGGRNISESEFKENFKKIYGFKGLARFEKLYRENFILEQDIKNIAELGANCLRLPFHYRLLEKRPFHYDNEGFKYLDTALKWAKKYKLKVILDLHAAAGSQNCDWHGDSQGRALLWEKKIFRTRTYRLWEAIATRFKDNEEIAGYDILNEAVVARKKVPLLKEFYRKTIRCISAIDKKHKIYIEGNSWAQEVEFLKSLLNDNIVVSIHVYQPLSFTFKFVHGLKYPGPIDGVNWNKERIYRYLEPYYKFSQKNKVKIFVGEFGINYRGNADGEVNYLKNILDVFGDYGFDYTYWTYKAIPRAVFPDGIYQYRSNPCCVRREGPVYGWENYYNCWRKHPRNVIKCFKTENYTLNQDIAKVLRKYFNK